MKEQGVLVHNPESDRMDIRFGPHQYYGGLHCGTTMDVLFEGKWIPTRIEMGGSWFLVGIRIKNIEGLIVRI